MATHDGAHTLPAVLGAYCRLVAPPGGWSLLVVDNGSADATRAILDGYADRLPLTILHEPRRGKNVALNTALAVALRDGDASLLVFTDDDARPEADWLLRLAECADAYPEAAIIGGSIVPDWGAPPPAWLLQLVPLGLTYGVTGAADGPVFPGLVWGANMAVRRAVFEAGHRFDESVGPRDGAYAMGGETEFNRRVADAGYGCRFCEGARVAHFVRPHQMRRSHILERAYRFGRGACRQARPDDAPRVFGAPRWMLPKLALEALGAARAWIVGDAERLFLRRWEMNFLRGYLAQAWTRAPEPRKGAGRVLITSHSGELGGMELRMAQEARTLTAAGYDGALATRRFPGFDAWAGGLRAERIEVSVFDPPKIFEQWQWRRLNRLRAQLLTSRRLRGYRPDLVHVAFCWATYGASALWLAQHCKIPAVISVHNAFPDTSFSAWHTPLLAEAFSNVRGIYAVSESSMQRFLWLFASFIAPATRLRVIPNGVDTSRFMPSAARREQARARLGIPRDALVLGSVARLSPQKRPHALIEMFCTLKPQFDKLYLVLVGAGPLEHELRRQALAAGIEREIVFAGFEPNVETLMPAFDLHLLLSRNEGFGISTIEAMACGVPAIATDVPGSADILRDSAGGMLLPLADQAEAAETVAELLCDPGRRLRMGKHGRAEVEARYAAAIVARQVVDFYAGLVR